MGQKNKYLEDRIPALYRKTALDIMIYTFIDAQRFTIPGISVENSAISFLKHYEVDEEDLTINKITTTFFRIQKELINESKS